MKRIATLTYPLICLTALRAIQYYHVNPKG